MNLKRKLVQSLVAGGLALALTTGFAFASIGTGTVTASSLRLRANANTSSATLTTAPKGAKVTVLEDAGSGWYKVSYNGQEGYMSGEWLSITLDGTVSSAAPTSTTGTVTASSLNVRSGPGTNYGRVGSLAKGVTVTILDSSTAGWYQITSGSITGYVSADYIAVGATASKATSSASEKGYVTASALNVRSGPGTGYAKVGSLSYGTSVTFQDSGVAGWYQISTGSISGYVSADYIAKGDAPATSASSVGNAAASMAWSLVGKRYASGAAGPNAFDCSGLVYYIYRQLGYTLARGSSSQYNQSGYFVSTSNLQPGDLLYFFDPAYDSSGGRLPTTHVGIYVGNNQYVHASSPSRGVTYDILFGGWSAKYLVGAKRIA